MADVHDAAPVKPPVFPHPVTEHPVDVPVPTKITTTFQPQVISPSMGAASSADIQPPESSDPPHDDSVQSPVVAPPPFDTPPATVTQPPPAPGDNPVASSPAATVPVKAPAKKRRQMFIGIPVVVVVLLAILFGAYTQFYLPSRPVNIVKQSLVNMLYGNNLTSLQFNSKFSITDKSIGQTFNGMLSGAYAKGGKFEANMSVNAIVTNVTVSVASTDGHDIYIKVGGLSGLSQLLGLAQSSGAAGASSLGTVLGDINNQWFVINQSLLQSIESSAKSDTNSNFSIGKLSQSEASTIGNLYQSHPFLTAQKTFAPAIIDGQSSYHYQMEINSGMLKSFFTGLQSAKLKDLTIDESSIASVENMINSANFNKYPFDIWIDKSNKIVDQLSLSTTDSSGDQLSVTLTLGHFNQPVTVTVPANAESVLQLLTQLGPDLSGIFSGGSSSTSDSLNLLQQSL